MEGFDKPGALSLGGRVQGTTKFVGTLEAASLFRQFGVNAQFVDFVGKVKAVGSISVLNIVS